jgi:orotate phosphoribosyltransferase
MAVAQFRHVIQDAEPHAALFDVIRERSFRRGKFILASGIESDLYFNMKATIMDPQGGLLVAREMLDLARAEAADLVGGLALGAVPTLGAIAAISAVDGRPMKTFFVRQEAKKHGTRELIEGLSPEESFEGKHVLVVDDVATKGGSIMQAISAARELGATVTTAMVIVDREKGAEAFLREHSVRLVSLFRESNFL